LQKILTQVDFGGTGILRLGDLGSGLGLGLYTVWKWLLASCF